MSNIIIYIYEHFTAAKTGVEQVNQDRRMVELAGCIILAGTNSEEYDAA